MDEVRFSGWRNLPPSSPCRCTLQGEKVKFSEDVRKIIRERAKDRCELCGSLALYSQIHHRRPRGMGGSKDPLAGSAANGILVHPACHARIESDRLKSYENGWLVKQEQDPSHVPIKRYFGWVMLATDGSMIPTVVDQTPS
jgi:5-methylcytosine-specific restriction protein A